MTQPIDHVTQDLNHHLRTQEISEAALSAALEAQGLSYDQVIEAFWVSLATDECVIAQLAEQISDSGLIETLIKLCLAPFPIKRTLLIEVTEAKARAMDIGFCFANFVQHVYLKQYVEFIANKEKGLLGEHALVEPLNYDTELQHAKDKFFRVGEV